MCVAGRGKLVVWVLREGEAIGVCFAGGNKLVVCALREGAS